MHDRLVLAIDWWVVEQAGAGWMIALAVVAWAILLLRVIRSPRQRRPALRIALSTTAVGSLLLAGLQPKRQVPIDPGTAILITSGADPATIDSLRQALQPELLATFDAALAEPPAITLLPDAARLIRQYPAVQRFHLVGSGLSAAALEVLSEKTVFFYPAPPPAGMIEFEYTDRVQEGDSLRFSGRYRQPANEARRLFLESPHGKDLLLASDSAGQYAFKRSIPARQRGRYLFEVVEEDEDRRILKRSPVPVRISAGEQPRILILNAAPAFETKYLKNQLSDRAYPVAVRSAISRNKYKTEFNNMPNRTLRPIRPATLSDFDLAVVDAAALPQLSPGERNALRGAVEGGLGLLILAPGDLPVLPPADRRFFFDFPLRSGAPRFQPAGAATAVELPKAPYLFEPAFGVYPLVRSRSGNAVAAYRLRGQGRVALLLAGATYRLLLQGQEIVYQQLWTDILEATARRSARPTSWELEAPLLIHPNHPLFVRLITPQADPVGQLAAPDSTTTSFHFRQAPLLPDRWTATLWPRRPGWHQLSLAASPRDSSWFYVPPAGAWEALRQMRRQQATARRLARRTGADLAGAAPATTSRPYPGWWWYLLFLLAAGGLWVEEKKGIGEPKK